MPAHTLDSLYGLGGLKVAVTGAGAGMGAETARLISGLGASVALLDIDVPGATAIADELAAPGNRARAIGLDLADEASCVAAFAAAVEWLGGLDAVVHVAGIYPRIGLFDLTAEKWNRIHDINARGTMLVLREAAKAMLSGGKGGRIVNISSNSAEKVTVNDHYAYASSKAAVNSLTRTAAYQLGPQGILVNAIMPGMVLSDTAKQSVASVTAPPSGPMLEPGRIVLGRPGAPIDVAAVAAFLIGPAASYITGQCFAVDGGFEVS
ncbi:MAG: SDR family oxidoreductase [Novosphingobium sp.]|nr:SDR family oxidoreductase [Novosphingobium sp.]